MHYMATMKTFDTEDLLELLKVCAHNLSCAYQETQEEVLFYVAEQARDACHYLMYTLEKEMPFKLIH